MIERADGVWVESPIHGWFELSYASYYVFPRVLMERMPLDWQERWLVLQEELEKAYEHVEGIEDMVGVYTVQRRNELGRFIYDPLREYRHPGPGIPKPRPESVSRWLWWCTRVQIKTSLWLRRRGWKRS